MSRNRLPVTIESVDPAVLVKAFEAGATVADLASMIGQGRSHVRSVLRAHGAAVLTRRERPTPDLADLPVIAERVRSGQSVRQVASDLNFPPRLVSEAAWLMGARPPSAGRKLLGNPVADPDLAVKAAALYRDGATCAQIMEQLHMSQFVVRMALEIAEQPLKRGMHHPGATDYLWSRRQRGAAAGKGPGLVGPLRWVDGRRSQVPVEVAAEVVALTATGIRRTDLTRHLNVSSRAIRRVLADEGVVVATPRQPVPVIAPVVESIMTAALTYDGHLARIAHAVDRPESFVQVILMRCPQVFLARRAQKILASRPVADAEFNFEPWSA